MTRHSVKIEQLDSGYGVYWNVDDEAGHLAIEGSLLNKPLFLLRSGVIFRIIQFDSLEWANEWLDENRHHWEEIVQVEDVKQLADTVARAEAAEADRLSLIADNTALEQRLNKALQSREDHFALEKQWERLRRAVQMVEWVGLDFYCPWCHGTEPRHYDNALSPAQQALRRRGHSPTCQRQAVLSCDFD
jgi:hypothetical protein